MVVSSTNGPDFHRQLKDLTPGISVIGKRTGDMKTKNFLNRNLSLCLLSVFVSVFALCGCAANLTRSLPCTQIRPNIVNIAAQLKASKVGMVPFVSKTTRIEGGHHEGLLQVRQPWIFGISKEQRELLYGNAGELAALSFASELKNQGLSVTLLEDVADATSEQCDFLLTGKVELVTLNTYGHGTKEGFGSAGNYWEATVVFSNLQLTDTRSNRDFHVDDIKSYAKLDNSPTKLDWTMLTVAVKSLKGAFYLHQMQTASNPLKAGSKAKAYVETWKADYTVDEYTISPIEVAARHAAAQFIQQITTRIQ